jgi:hypothetical protein
MWKTIILDKTIVPNRLLEKMPPMRVPNDFIDPKLLRDGQSLKKIGLKRLIETIKPSIILLQEIMTNGEKITQELSKMFCGWEFNFIDDIGRSQGNITRWKKCSFTLTNSWDFPTRLGISLFSLDLGKYISILNVYGSCMDRVEY